MPLFPKGRVNLFPEEVCFLLYGGVRGFVKEVVLGPGGIAGGSSVFIGEGLEVEHSYTTHE